MKRPDTTPKTLPPASGFVPLRGKSGTLYGFIDPSRRVVEFKRKGLAPEMVDLSEYLKKD